MEEKSPLFFCEIFINHSLRLVAFGERAYKKRLDSGQSWGKNERTRRRWQWRLSRNGEESEDEDGNRWWLRRRNGKAH
jgi:hypothetical protein